MRAIILEQRAWMENALPNCNPDHIFLQPRDLNKPFAKRSLDKIIKDYSPVDAVKGDKRNIVMKGSAGAFCTMCRSFLNPTQKRLWLPTAIILNTQRNSPDSRFITSEKRTIQTA